MERTVTIRLPQEDWRQIVSDIENMCGRGRELDPDDPDDEGIEILSHIEVLDGEE